MGTITHKVMQTLGDKKVAMNKGLDIVEDEETGRNLTLEECDDLELLNDIAFKYYTEAFPEVDIIVSPLAKLAVRDDVTPVPTIGL